MKIADIAAPRQLYLLLGFSCFLIALRSILFGNNDFLYLYWNLFLALIPYLISSALLWHVQHGKVSPLEIIISGTLWLIFYPNAPYIITDLIHLEVVADIPLWFDMLLMFSAALSGLMLAFHSLYQIEELLHRRYVKLPVHMSLAPVFLFTGFGIYLGRFLRFNSWDIIVEPRYLLKATWEILATFGTLEALAFIMLFAVFLWVMYAAWHPMLRATKSER